MKVTIIGGGGRVGSNAAFAMQCAGIVSEIQILDYNTKLAEGEALDLLHGASRSIKSNFSPSPASRTDVTDLKMSVSASPLLLAEKEPSST